MKCVLGWQLFPRTNVGPNTKCQKSSPFSLAFSEVLTGARQSYGHDGFKMSSAAKSREKVPSKFNHQYLPNSYPGCIKMKTESYENSFPELITKQ